MVDPDGTEETKRSRPRSGTARNRKKTERKQEIVGLKGDEITMDEKDRNLLLENCEKEKEQLKTEINLYRSMFERSHVAQVVIDPEFKIVNMNDAFCTIVDYPREKLLGMDFRDFKGKKMLDYLYDKGQGLVDALELKQPVSAHAAWIATNGTHIVNRNIIPFFDETGQIKDVYIIYNDVTEIENEMAEIEHLKKQAEAIVQLNPMPILLWDKDLKVIASNKTFLDLTGFSKEQADRLTIADFKYNSQSGQTVADTLKTGVAGMGEAAIQFPSGERVVERYNIPLVDARGESANVLTVYNNITDQKRAIKDILEVSSEAEKGNLSARTKENNYTGDFFEIARGINRTLDAVIEPIVEANTVLARMAVNDHTKGMEGTYQGVFADIQKNVNLVRDRVNHIAGSIVKIGEGDISEYEEYKKIGRRSENDRVVPGFVQCLGALRGLTRDTGMLEKAAVEGKLDTRADASKHKGDFRVIVEGVNATLDAVIGPLNVAAEYVDRISKGDIPPKITDLYKGDFNEIKNNLNACIDGLQGLVEANNVLGRMAVNDHSKGVEGNYVGLFAEVKVHVNEVRERLRGVTKQINEIAVGDTKELEELKRIGKRSEQDHLLPAIINCLEVVDRLIKDTAMLAKAAEEGKLDTRADLSRHIGEYKTIVQGINNTLDAVIGPLNVAAEYVDRISKGDIPPKITDKYNGDFNEIKNNLNGCIDIMNGLLSETDVLIQATKDGKLDTRGNDQKFPGGWGKLVGGVNGLIDAFVHPINVTAEYVDRISKGDIPPKITDLYSGDFNEIKNNLNACIDGLQGLVEANNVLGRMAVNDHSKGVEGNYLGLFAEVKVHVNEVRDRLRGVTKQINEIAVGDTKELEELKRVGKRSEQDHLLPAIINCLEVVDRLIKDTAMLAKAAEEGKLDTRADLSRHIGEYKTIVQGINHTLDAVIGPLNVAAEYVDRISKGEIPAKITDTYKGDFNEIKNNLNQCIDVMNGLLSETDVLIKATKDGKLDTRGNVQKFPGGWGKLVGGVNDLIDAFVHPLNVTAEYVDRISKGEIPAKITDTYSGDFNEIKNNLNQCIDVMNGLLSETDILIQATKDGKLDTRGNAQKFPGGWGKLVGGVNDLIDAFVHPINVTADYVDRISKGEIPQKITDNYNGDFNEIKKTLNACIDAINGLVADANMLAKAAVEGRLKTRADATKHQGDYRKIVEGVNNTLDSVINPVNEAMRMANEFAKCNFVARVDENLHVEGDFIKFKEALNSIGTEVSKAVIMINQQIMELASSAQEANASIEEVSSGAEQIAKNAAGVSTNAERGNEGISQVLRAMEDLNQTVTDVAQKAEKVSQLTEDANTLSTKGTGLAEQAERGMQSITTSSNEVDKIIVDIKAEMDKIGKIVGLISDLANQTNLLALNAAIEAARAGEAGRGFAVVATEVKSLAQESRASAENIADMIGTLQKKSIAAGEAVASSNREVKAGSEALSQTLRSFKDIAKAIEDISRNVVEVASVSEEQAATVEEVTASVNEVHGMVQATAKDAMDAAAASEEASASIDQITKVMGGVNTIVNNVSKEMAKFKV